MKGDQYRDLFSDAFEGCLDAGLRGAFEARIATDAELASEYEAYGVIRRELDAMAAEAVPAPTYLSARILDRVEARARPATSVFGFGRSLGIAGLAALAIAGGVWALQRPSGDIAMAGTVASARAGELRVRPSAAGARIAMGAEAGAEVTISSAPDGIVLQRYRLTTAPLRAELTNPNRGAAAFLVQIAGRPSVHVALPGSESKPAFPATGSGDLLGFAKFLSRAYGTIVIVRGADVSAPAVWNLAGRDVVADANRSLAGRGLAARLANGALEISSSAR